MQECLGFDIASMNLGKPGCRIVLCRLAADGDGLLLSWISIETGAPVALVVALQRLPLLCDCECGCCSSEYEPKSNDSADPID